jgi:membrane-associated phospholipid phosphatase
MLTGLFREADRRGYRLIHRRLRARRVDPIMVAATRAGTKSAAWLGVSVVLALFGGKHARRTAVVTIAATLTAQAIVNVGMKPLVRRKRPFHRSRLRPALLVKPPREHSWPSGHAASSAAAVTALMAAYPGQALPLSLLAVVISYSRVYVGVHYPFDVAAGTAIGAAVGAAWVSATRTAGSRVRGL